MLSVRPASHSDICRLGRYLPAPEFKGLAVQLVRGPAWAIVADDEVLALAGLVKVAPGVAEFWSQASEGLTGSGHGLAVWALVRRHLKSLPRELAIVAHVRPGHRAGRVIARYMGLRFSGPVLSGALEKYQRP